MRSIPQQISANKRASFFYSVLLVVLLIVLGGVVAGALDPNAVWLGAGIAGIAGIIAALVARYAGPQIVLNVSHARNATALEQQTVQNVAEEMAIAAGIPMPQVYIIDDTAPNAFATGSDPKSGIICISTGLLRTLNRDELQGVIAHEMAHIRNYDIRLMTTLSLVAGIIPLIADIFWNSMRFGGGRRRSSDGESNQLQVIFFVLAIVLAILAPIFATLLKLAVSRKREFLADSTASQLTRNPEGLASALRKLEANTDRLEAANHATAHMFIVNPFKSEATQSFLNNLTSTHPPIQERIKNLLGTYGVNN